MNSEEVFKRYDVRGKFPEELDEEFALRMGKALGTLCTEDFSQRVVVCKDSKKTSTVLKEKLVEGLTSTGVNVVDIGTGPTDFAAFCGVDHGAVSVQVTSSHMPLEFNGFKFMYPEGNSFTNSDLNRLKNVFRNKKFNQGSGDIKSLEKVMRRRYRHRARIKAAHIGSQDLDKKIVFDSMGGATDVFMPQLLRDLGAEVVELSKGREDVYRNPPNPKPGMLDELKEKVEEEDADLGLAADLDGDRLTVYRDGFLRGEDVFALLAKAVGGDTVASIDTAEVVEKVVEDRGGKTFYTRVGDPFVLEKVLEEDADVAGEPNGHYAVKDFVPYNSAVLTGLIVAGLDIDERLSELPDYSVERFSVEVEDKEKVMRGLKSDIRQLFGVESDVDGVKFSTQGFSVLVRPSGSSEKVRGVVSGESSEGIDEVISEVRSLISENGNG